MPPRVRKPPVSEMKEILKRLNSIERLLKNIPTTNLGHCVDFSALPPGTLPNPFTVNVTGRILTFSTTSPLGLEIKPNPTAYNPGLRVPSNLTILISGPVFGTVEVEVSSYASLSWEAYDGAGNPQTSIPPPPAPHSIGSYAIKLIGQIERLEFVGNNEECIKQLCI